MRNYILFIYIFVIVESGFALEMINEGLLLRINGVSITSDSLIIKYECINTTNEDIAFRRPNYDDLNASLLSISFTNLLTDSLSFFKPYRIVESRRVYRIVQKKELLIDSHSLICLKPWQTITDNISIDRVCLPIDTRSCRLFQVQIHVAPINMLTIYSDFEHIFTAALISQRFIFYYSP